MFMTLLATSFSGIGTTIVLITGLAALLSLLTLVEDISSAASALTHFECGTHYSDSYPSLTSDITVFLILFLTFELELVTILLWAPASLITAGLTYNLAVIFFLFSSLELCVLG